MKNPCSSSRKNSHRHHREEKLLTVEREYLSALTQEEVLLHIIYAHLHPMTERRKP